MRSQPRGDRRSVQDPFQPPAAPRRQVGFLKKEIGRFFFAKNRPLRKRKVESAVPRGDGGARATARQTWRRDPRAARCTRTTRVSASLCAVSVAAPRDRVFAARQRALVRGRAAPCSAQRSTHARAGPVPADAARWLLPVMVRRAPRGARGRRAWGFPDARGAARQGERATGPSASPRRVGRGGGCVTRRDAVACEQPS